MPFFSALEVPCPIRWGAWVSFSGDGPSGLGKTAVLAWGSGNSADGEGNHGIPGWKGPQGSSGPTFLAKSKL